MGLGAYPASDPQFLGMLGMHGTYEANLAMHECDVMVCVGARFDDRITGVLSAFSPNSKKIHIDIDPSSINKNVPVDVPIVGDVANVLEDMIEMWKSSKAKPDQKALKSWWKKIDDWRAQDCLKYVQKGDVIKPQYAIQRLYETTKNLDEVYITTEVGQHQMWAAQFYGFEKPNHWLTSGGIGTMGPGEVQCMSAGTGIQHSEYNASQEEEVQLLQMWILPAVANLEPGYEQKSFTKEQRQGTLLPIVSGMDHPGALKIHQDTTLYIGRIRTQDKLHSATLGKFVGVCPIMGRGYQGPQLIG